MNNQLIAYEKKKIAETQFNSYLKRLPKPVKKQVINLIITNALIFPTQNKTRNRAIMDNWRYDGKGGPSHSTKILVYLSAKQHDQQATITDIFPEIDPQYVENMMPWLENFYNQYINS